ncbi:MAG: flippase-like domain-containing protein [Magnetococcales bacterium]|nr:flippase-like domain-containing protein [Magnetococcales bacterium]
MTKTSAFLFKGILSAAIGALLLYLVFRKVDGGLFLEYLLNADLSLLGLALVLLFASILCKAARWRVLLSAIGKPIGYGNVLASLSVGLLVDLVVPGKVGELARVHLIGRKERTDRTAALGTVVVERLFDLLTVMLITLGAIHVFRIEDSMISGALVSFSHLLIVGVALLVLAIVLRKKLFRLAKKYLRIASIDDQIWRTERIFQGIFVVNNLFQTLLSLGLTFLMWAFFTASFLPILYSISIQGTHPPLHAIFVLLPLLIFGTGIPTIPGGLGVYEYVVLLCIQITLPDLALNTPEASSSVAALGIVFHVVLIIPELMMGSWFFLKEGERFSLTTLLQRRRNKDVPETPEGMRLTGQPGEVEPTPHHQRGTPTLN